MSRSCANGSYYIHVIIKKNKIEIKRFIYQRLLFSLLKFQLREELPRGIGQGC